MKEYHKIQTIFFRDPENRNRTLLEGQYSIPEFEYLKDNIWVFTEKIDGTNIRISFEDGMCIFSGKTDSSQIPATLVLELQKMFTPDKMKAFEGLTLFGEGYGDNIHKGSKYIEGGVSFILFDVQANDSEIWLERSNVEDIAFKLDIPVVPIIGGGTLQDAIDIVKNNNFSAWGEFEAEGIVARPKSELLARNGDRIITKIKAKDFRIYK